jgi:hypothetical protein
MEAFRTLTLGGAGAGQRPFPETEHQAEGAGRCLTEPLELTLSSHTLDISSHDFLRI